MKTTIFRLQRFIVLVIAMFLIGLSTSFAQITPSGTPSLGIYGSVPVSYRSSTRYVRLNEFPAIDPGLQYTLPVNGLKNFNFYYKPDGTGFLPAGTYSIDYLNSSFLPVGAGDYPITYAPNSGYTNGVQVRAFNNPPSTPFGIHGTIKVQIPGGGGAVAPLQNAYVAITADGSSDGRELRTNGAGYFSFYYDSSIPQSFLIAHIHWSILISGVYNGCPYSGYDFGNILWLPDVNPNSSTYYSNPGASYDNGTMILTSTKPGCGA